MLQTDRKSVLITAAKETTNQPKSPKGSKNLNNRSPIINYFPNLNSSENSKSEVSQNTKKQSIKFPNLFTQDEMNDLLGKGTDKNLTQMLTYFDIRNNTTNLLIPNKIWGTLNNQEKIFFNTTVKNKVLKHFQNNKDITKYINDRFESFQKTPMKQIPKDFLKTLDNGIEILKNTKDVDKTILQEIFHDNSSPVKPIVPEIKPEIKNKPEPPKPPKPPRQSTEDLINEIMNYVPKKNKSYEEMENQNLTSSEEKTSYKKIKSQNLTINSNSYNINIVNDMAENNITSNEALQALQQELETIKKESETLNTALETSNKELETLNTALETSNKELEISNKELQEKLKNLETELVNATNEIKKTNDEIVLLSQKGSITLKEIEEINNKKAILTGLTNKKADLQNEKIATENEIKENKDKITQNEESRKTITEQVTDLKENLEKNANVMNNKLQQIKDLENQIKKEERNKALEERYNILHEKQLAILTNKEKLEKELRDKTNIENMGKETNEKNITENMEKKNKNNMIYDLDKVTLETRLNTALRRIYSIKEEDKTQLQEAFKKQLEDTKDTKKINQTLKTLGEIENRAKLESENKNKDIKNRIHVGEDGELHTSAGAQIAAVADVTEKAENATRDIKDRVEERDKVAKKDVKELIETVHTLRQELGPFGKFWDMITGGPLSKAENALKNAEIRAKDNSEDLRSITKTDMDTFQTVYNLHTQAKSQTRDLVKQSGREHQDLDIRVKRLARQFNEDENKIRELLSREKNSLGL